MEQSPSCEANITLHRLLNFQPFVEPESSLPFTQKSATNPCYEPYKSSLHPKPYFSSIYFNIILTSTPSSSEWSMVGVDITLRHFEN
jgi:hypothetical protein